MKKFKHVYGICCDKQVTRAGCREYASFLSRIVGADDYRIASSWTEIEAIEDGSLLLVIGDKNLKKYRNELAWKIMDAEASIFVLENEIISGYYKSIEQLDMNLVQTRGNRVSLYDELEKCAEYIQKGHVYYSEEALKGIKRLDNLRNLLIKDIGYDAFCAFVIDVFGLDGKAKSELMRKLGIDSGKLDDIRTAFCKALGYPPNKNPSREELRAAVRAILNDQIISSWIDDMKREDARILQDLDVQ